VSVGAVMTTAMSRQTLAMCRVVVTPIKHVEENPTFKMCFQVYNVTILVMFRCSSIIQWIILIIETLILKIIKIEFE